jgi:exodeoxyribonuclease VIII
MMFIDETNEAYHARTEVSASMLKKLDESPRLFEAHYVTRTIPSRQSDAMRLGSAVHAAILEYALFDEMYVVCPAECSDRRTKAYKEWANGVGMRQILTDDEAARIAGCQKALLNNKTAATIIDAVSIVEKSFAYEDFLTQVPCRVRFDALAGDVIVDLKTVSDGSEAEFVRSVANYRYHLQAAHYLEGFRTLDPSRDWQFVFITLETVAPYRCRVFKLDDESLMIAANRRTELLESYKRRLADGDWSEENENEVVTLSLPKWFKHKELAV